PSGRLADVRDPPSVRRPGKTDHLTEARLPLGSATRRHVQVDGPHGGVRGVGARAQLVEGVSSGEPRVALKKPLPRGYILVGHTRHQHLQVPDALAGDRALEILQMMMPGMADKDVAAW